MTTDGGFVRFISLALFLGCSQEPTSLPEKGQPTTNPSTENHKKTQPSTTEQEVKLPFTLQTQLSDSKRATRKLQKKYEGPLIDTHFHAWYHKKGVKSELRALNELSKSLQLKSVIIMPTPFQGFNPREERSWKKTNPSSDRIKTAQRKRIRNALKNPKSGPSTWKKRLSNISLHYFCDTLGITNQLAQSVTSKPDANQLAASIKPDLKDPNCLGIGEVALYHGPKSSTSSRADRPSEHLHQVYHQPNSHLVERLFRQTFRRNRWLDLHIEPRRATGKPHPHLNEALYQILSKYPQNQVIISHTMMTSPANVRAWMTHFPNLYSNIKIVLNYWDHLEPVTAQNGEVYEDWALLFEEMPERFFIGSDFKFMRTPKDNTKAYGAKLVLYQNLLGSLSEVAAKKIAYTNAQSVLLPAKK